jgi:aspartyl/glutamyl-tRNA(Asn/Gln) amidotransferase subunit A (EC 6.3.5.-)
MSGGATYITAAELPPTGEGPLSGLDIAIKDNISTAGVRTTCGSRMLAEYVPPYDATVVERVRAAGARIVGKANMDEFGMGGTTETSAFGAVPNPVDDTRVAGGSSGGSAVAVAEGTADIALGSDTGGSVRNPAAFCGVVGLKPTYGLVSRYGLVAYANSLEQIGPLGPDVMSVARLLGVIAGADPRDATTQDRPAADPAGYTEAVDAGVEGMTIGVVPELFDGADAAVATAVRDRIDMLAAAGASITTVALPALEHAVAAYYVIAMAEASSNLARFDGVRYGVGGGRATGTPPSPAPAGPASAPRSPAASSWAPMPCRQGTTTATTRRRRMRGRGCDRSSPMRSPRSMCSRRRRCRSPHRDSVSSWRTRSRCTRWTSTRCR